MVGMTCYLDESGTDNDSTVAVVGGLVMDMKQYFWLDVAWRKVLAKHNIPWPLHMKEFGQHGKFKHVTSEERRALFYDIASALNDNKTYSIASTLSSAEYHRHFDGITKLSMYGASFMRLAMMNGIQSKLMNYPYPMAYLLDCGNRFRSQAEDAHTFMKSKDGFKKVLGLNLGTIGFDSDDEISALQAADVVSWSVRRKLASELKSGFEPLAELFEGGYHLEIEYKEETMKMIADVVRGN